MRLDTLVRETYDPRLLLLIQENLKVAQQRAHNYEGTLSTNICKESLLTSVEEHVREQQLRLCTNPVKTVRLAVKRRQQRLQKEFPEYMQVLHEKIRLLEQMPAVLRQEETERLAQQRWLQMMEEAQNNVQANLQGMLQDMERQQQLPAILFNEYAKAAPESVRDLLKDRNPLNRWVAVKVIERRRLHLETDLIELLTDPYVQVRQGARQALVRLSRGNDFGPAANTTLQQTQRSQHLWRNWVAMQETPVQGGSSSPPQALPPEVGKAVGL